MGKQFEGRVAIVTGASRGIGEAIARRLAAEGAKVVLASRKLEPLEAIAKSIQEAGGEALAVAAHVGKAEHIDALVKKTIEAYGRLDILVNNAATNPVFGPVMFCDENAAKKIFDVNFFGAFLLAKACMPHMQKSNYGKIVNITSTAGLHYSPMMGMYCASKAALQMLTKVMAAEWGTFGVRVNAVAPGLVKTDFSSVLWNTEDFLKLALAKQPIQKLLAPEDIVGAVLYLAGPDSDFVTGHTLVVDAGSIV